MEYYVELEGFETAPSSLVFAGVLFSGLGMVFHNLYSLRAKGQNPLCGKPSTVIHSHTPRTDRSPPFRPRV